MLLKWGMDGEWAMMVQFNFCAVGGGKGDGGEMGRVQIMRLVDWLSRWMCVYFYLLCIALIYVKGKIQLLANCSSRIIHMWVLVFLSFASSGLILLTIHTSLFK